MTNDLLQLGALAVIFLFAIREFFGWMKSRKEEKNEGGGGKPILEAMLTELRTMNENHLHSLKDAINDGNNRVVDAISSSSSKQVELLGEIKGKLDR